MLVVLAYIHYMPSLRPMHLNKLQLELIKIILNTKEVAHDYMQENIRNEGKCNITYSI